MTTFRVWWLYSYVLHDLTYNAGEGDGRTQVHVVFLSACKLKEHFHNKIVVRSVKVAYDCPIKRLKQFCREVLHYKKIYTGVNTFEMVNDMEVMNFSYYI